MTSSWPLYENFSPVNPAKSLYLMLLSVFTLITMSVFNPDLTHGIQCQYISWLMTYWLIWPMTHWLRLYIFTYQWDHLCLRKPFPAFPSAELTSLLIQLRRSSARQTRGELVMLLLGSWSIQAFPWGCILGGIPFPWRACCRVGPQI